MESRAPQGRESGASQVATGKKWLDEGFFVKKDQRVEGLVLGGCADVLMGELSEEGLELCLTGKAFCVTISQVANETQQPALVTALG